jgi:hypothetical protein
MSTPKRLRSAHQLPSQLTPGPDHAASTSRFWDNAAFRTTVQGLSIDVLLAVSLVIYTATSSDHVQWAIIPLAIAKTALTTLASSIMKRVKPTVAQAQGIGT